MFSQTRNAVEYLHAHRFFSGFSIEELTTLVSYLKPRQIPERRQIASVEAIPMLVVLGGTAVIRSQENNRLCPLGTVVSRHWAGNQTGQLAALTAVTILELTPAQATALRASHPGLMRKLQHRLAATGAKSSPIGPVWSGRRGFRKRSQRPTSPSRVGSPFELVAHSRLILPMV